MGRDCLMFGSTLALIAAGLCGCDDGSITVLFEPDTDEAPIARHHLVVYEEPAGVAGDPDQRFTCDRLAFGEIDDDALDASVVSELSVDVGESGSLGDIPREGRKLFFAESLTADSVSVFAGCAERDLLEGDVVVDIEPELRRNVVIQGDPFGDGSGDVGVIVTGLLGENLAGSTIRFELLGAGGFSQEGSVVSLEGARSTMLALDKPPLAGPVRLTVRVRWSATGVEPVQGFLAPPLCLDDEPPTCLAMPTVGVPRAERRPTDLIEIGRIGPGGNLGIVALGVPAADNAREAQIHCFDSAGALVISDTVNVDGANTLGLIRGSDSDRIITVRGGQTASEWVELGCGPASVTTVVKPNPFGQVPIKLAPMSSCASPGSADDHVLAQIAANLVLPAASPEGDPLAAERIDLSNLDFDNGTADRLSLRASGCVSAADGPQTAIAADATADGSTTFAPFLVTLDDGGNRIGPLQATASVAWLGRESELGDSQLLLGELTNEGPTVGRYNVQLLGGSGLTGDLTGEDPLPSIALETAGGDVDGDGIADVVSLLAVGQGDSGGGFLLHASLGLPGTDDRLRAFIPNAIELRSARLRVADINGDGVDDIILRSAAAIVVLEMGSLP